MRLLVVRQQRRRQRMFFRPRFSQILLVLAGVALAYIVPTGRANEVGISFVCYFTALFAAMWLWHRSIHRMLAARCISNRSPPDAVEVRSKILPICFWCGLVWFLAFLSGIVAVMLLIGGANWPLISALAGAATVPVISAFSVRDALKLIESRKDGGAA